MRRVVVLGPGGAGKSTLAAELGQRLDLPVIELDKEFWDVDLSPLPDDVWRRRQRALVAADTWIMDGDLGRHDDLEPRLLRADTVIVLDLPLFVCVWRTLRRARERRDYWRWLWRWRRESQPVIMRAIARCAPHANLVELRTRREVHRWLRSHERL